MSRTFSKKGEPGWLSRSVPPGRLCNQIIRGLALSFLAKKNDLKVLKYGGESEINKLGIYFYNGNKSYDSRKLLVIVDNNYMKYYNSPIHNNVNLNKAYFQTQEITDIIYNHLQSESVVESVKSHNPFKNRYDSNNDLFIHIRLGDVASKNPGLNYYKNAISKLPDYENIYIGSDSLDHPIVKELEKQFSAKLVNDTPTRTIQYGITCKHIILSHGSFSAMIGYLTQHKNIYYPNKKPSWGHLTLFIDKGWNAVDY